VSVCAGRLAAFQQSLCLDAVPGFVTVDARQVFQLPEAEHQRHSQQYRNVQR